MCDTALEKSLEAMNETFSSIKSTNSVIPSNTNP